MNPTRTLAWFSAGAASAVATKIALAERDDVEVWRIDTGSEHADNDRFHDDCCDWFGVPVHLAKSDRYADTWDVWESKRYIVGPDGAPCTGELKRRVRTSIERPNDVHVFGYTHSEGARLERFLDANPGVDVWAPLIEKNLSHSDCLSIVERAGIELPVMYRLGYRNNNCIGCVKGGMGYWNKIRRDFPEVFDRMARLERDIGASVNRDDNGRVFLDELDPERGDYDTEPGGCSLFCADVEVQIS